MTPDDTEFDRFAEQYEELLQDPIRDRFVGGNPLFFHTRKRDVVRQHFLRAGVSTHSMSYLDVGCGKGELLTLLKDDFGCVAGCDPSDAMLQAGGLAAKGIDARVQKEHLRLPFDGAQFDFVTAVCVFHHIPVDQRSAMVREMRRVLKRGGTAAIIEHNPYNPATRIIVSRTPVDADAVLLSASETCNLLRSSGFGIDAKNYFLLFPQSVYKGLYWLEKALTNVPLGGQYTVFARAT